MKSRRIGPVEIHRLKSELRQIRNTSLLATRQGNYRQVARLTARAAEINKLVMEAEGQIALVDI